MATDTLILQRTRHRRDLSTRPYTDISQRVLAAAPLLIILAAQAFLTVRLSTGAYASGDEGRYIYAGHQLIYELWHGGGSPYYETSFSGAPVIFPVATASPADRKEVTTPNLHNGEKPLRFDRMSGLDEEQLDELEERVAELLEEPWDKGKGARGN
jgi:hypothetical protein